MEQNQTFHILPSKDYSQISWFDTTNSFGESDGDFEKSTLGLHWEDLEDVVKWAQQQAWFSAPLALAGHSKGGYAVARYAEDHPEEVSFVVPVAPVVSGQLSFDAFKERDPEGLEKWKREEVIEEASKHGHLKRKHWFQMEERLSHDLLPHADKITMPIIFIVGSQDDSCPAKHVKILYDAIPGDKKEMKILEGAPHSFYKDIETEACTNAIKLWLGSYLK